MSEAFDTAGVAPRRWESFAAWFKEGPYASVVCETRLPANAPVHLVHTRQPAGRYPDPAIPDLALQLVIRATGHVDLGALRGRVPARAGRLAIAPAGVACDYEASEPFEVLMLALPFAAAQRVLDEAFGGALADFGPVHRHGHAA